MQHAIRYAARCNVQRLRAVRIARGLQRLSDALADDVSGDALGDGRGLAGLGRERTRAAERALEHRGGRARSKGAAPLDSGTATALVGDATQRHVTAVRAPGIKSRRTGNYKMLRSG